LQIRITEKYILSKRYLERKKAGGIARRERRYLPRPTFKFVVHSFWICKSVIYETQYKLSCFCSVYKKGSKKNQASNTENLLVAITYCMVQILVLK